MRIEPFDRSDIADIPLHDGGNVVTRPVAAPRKIRTPQHFRIAAAQGTLCQLPVGGDLGWLRQHPGKHLPDEATGGSPDLGLRQGQQGHDLHAPG